jgi:uncharacterized protein DUF6894
VQVWIAFIRHQDLTIVTLIRQGEALPSRYYFHLTDGQDAIRDEDGIEVANLAAALIYATEAIEELRREMSSSSEEWEGWRLEIVDSLGQLAQSLPLEVPVQNRRMLH